MVATAGLVSKVSGADGTLVWQRELLTSLDDAAGFFIANTDRISPRGIDFDSTGNVVVSVLTGLMDAGEIDGSLVADAIKRYDIDPDAVDPYLV